MTKLDFDARYRVQHIHSDKYVVFDKEKGKTEAGPFTLDKAKKVWRFMRQHCH